jgi:tRNA G18 (ribose-2'-O)-methylase SpoU
VAELEASLSRSLDDPTSGYDSRFGKSALKCYKSFVFPKEENEPRSSASGSKNLRRPPRPSLASAARSCAQQIDFLVQRHRAHQEEWVRHHDAPPATLPAATESTTTTFPIVLVLDNVRSAFNVGSMFRTADAAGCELVVTTGLTPHPGGSGSDKVRKTSLGAERVVPSLHFETVYDALEHLQGKPPFAGYEIVALETTRDSVPYSRHAFNKEKGVILIVGNEVTGVRPDVMVKADRVLEIPMYGAKNSLNVAACAPVVLFEILRQWNREEGVGTPPGSTSGNESRPSASPLAGTDGSQ